MKTPYTGNDVIVDYNVGGRTGPSITVPPGLTMQEIDCETPPGLMVDWDNCAQLQLGWKSYPLIIDELA